MITEAKNAGPAAKIDNKFFSLLSAPLRMLWWAVRHPLLSMILLLALLCSALMTSLQFSGAAQEHFSNAAQYFGISTVAQVLTNSANIANSELMDVKSKLNLESRKLQQVTAELDSTKAKLKQKETGITGFKTKAQAITRQHNVRMTKVAIKTAAGEVMAWVPVVGDVASMGFAVAGTVEMCRMFKELEVAATEFGMPITLYSGTFCEAPAEFTVSLLATQYNIITDSLTRSLNDQAKVRERYWSNKLFNWLGN
ncbi:hypothetical protein NOR51B_793 [Luminiphilus syltensis NOR5-1B]|uniref:Uncharacterized protein n=1 Tax=Luminiphilus syltensis NOR5-1B TaxID=565045 RepID=B8KVQ1_9GAMM|nr:hypothetical protein [Luminiphilus syltensis]EED34853.1 hypothetical protein NOR51B_793 [Luminiphilus syltensis NOR5-1B]